MASAASPAGPTGRSVVGVMVEAWRLWRKMVGMELTSGAGQPVWTRTLIAWHIVFWALLGVTALVSLIGDLSGRHHLVVLGALAVLGLAYHFVGRPAMVSRNAVAARIYLVLQIACVAVVVALYPPGVFLMFIASPQIWLLSDKARDSVVLSVLLVFTVGAAQLWSAGWTINAFWDILPWMLISLVVSMMLGIWIDKVIAQSQQRANLIEELESARDELAEAHHTAGVMAERERMAREIHDTLAQGMTSVVMLAQTAAVELQRGSLEPVAGRLAAIEDTARENLAEARALVAAFTPVALTGATLAEVLRRQAERFAAETGVDVQVSLDMPDDEVAALPQAQQVVLLRAAQESLANVRKHAGATSVVISLGMSAAGVRIEIHDDGSGFAVDAAEGSGTGFGLAAMRGRVEESGGTVSVESAPGRGTRVAVLIPSAGENA
ncbi:signal transduction histidine kinase [Kribbella voronezhensis]|uniref:Oxygen sensor histidine kinase NreB n=1 Tax=Kribbella voronezhensis TaxID=2512212 RepID=A0A4R7T6U6_9ACTN|nr:sensor histidine kinase [Kribbella voronezhensis]TDU87445.1 signal transduction histidine kinase [Kribbella voronezhensis]